jgi:hypothetical protein
VYSKLFCQNSRYQTKTFDIYECISLLLQISLPSFIRQSFCFVFQGSGKTLAFSIPIIHHILREQEAQRRQTSGESESESDIEPAETDEDHEPMMLDETSLEQTTGDKSRSYSILSFSWLRHLHICSIHVTCGLYFQIIVLVIFRI